MHALDTRDLTAACIDLDALTGRRDLQSLGLDVTPDGGEFRVVDAQNRALAVVDAKTFRVRAATARATESGGGDGDLSPGLWLVGAGVLLSIGAIVLFMRRRGAVAPT